MASRTEELLEFTSNTPPVIEVFEADRFWICFSYNTMILGSLRPPRENYQKTLNTESIGSKP